MNRASAAPANLDDLRAVLLETGRIDPADRLTPITGGVSSIVARVDGDGAGAPWVVKAPLAQLAVADEWLVDRSRGDNEAAALRFLNGRLGPARIPHLLFFDAERTILGQQMIPGPPPTYKDELLAGRARPELAAALGAAAGVLHQLDPPEDLAGDGPRRLFDDLRLDPYYRATGARLPELGPALDALIAETVAATPRRLVHGDFTPKNVLVWADQPVVVDWEVVHTGDASFDLATITAHLILKSLRDMVTGAPEPLLNAVSQFWRAYDGPAHRGRAVRHAGAVMLARLYGKSPVDYMASPAARRRADSLARFALGDGCADVEDLIEAARRTHHSKDAS